MLKKKIEIYKIIKEPLFYIIIFSFILYIIGINWGLPGINSWQSDDLAPTVPVQGLFRLFSFGYAIKYPIVHQVILAISNIPIIITALIHSIIISGGFNKEVFKNLLYIDINYLSAFTFVDRLISVLMGTLTSLFVYLSGKKLFNKSVGIVASILIPLNPIFNLSSHVSKVEIAYIFWAIVAFYYLIKSLKDNNRIDYILCAFYTCFCFGSKDQGYSFFILPFLIFFIIYPFFSKNEINKNLLLKIFNRNFIYFIFSFIVGTIVVENIILNYSGLVERFYMLIGEHGFRSVGYTLSFKGITTFFLDSNLSMINNILGLPIFIFIILGLIFLFFDNKKDIKVLLINLIYFFASLSYYLFFLQIIRQTKSRFQLPISIFLIFYAAYAIVRIFEIVKNYNIKYIYYSIILASFIFSFYLSFSFNLEILFDTRYDVEKWMHNNINKDSKIEYYGGYSKNPRLFMYKNAYEIKINNFLGFENRNPDFIILSSRFYPFYLSEFDIDKENNNDGELLFSEKQKKKYNNDMHDFLILLFDNKLNYSIVKRFDRKLKFIKATGLTPDHIIIFTKNNK